MDVKQNDYSADVKNPENGIDEGVKASQLSPDQYFCPRCEQSMHFNEKDEHDDWHFAKDLETQDQDGAAPSQPPAQAPQSQQLKPQPASDSKSEQPPGYAPPSYPPPSHPPPANGASRTRAIRHHTNQVIEAAKVRARDEVRNSGKLNPNEQSTNSPKARNAECPADSAITIWYLQ